MQNSRQIIKIFILRVYIDMKLKEKDGKLFNTTDDYLLTLGDLHYNIPRKYVYLGARKY